MSSTRTLSALTRTVLAFAGMVFATTSSPGRAQSELAGSYRTEVNEQRAVVSTWGEDCGPRPESDTRGPRPNVEVRVDGAHLVLVFPDRTLRTDACWSPNPSVQVANTTALRDRWRIECRTGQGDSKREAGIYTVTVGAGGVLELVEESSYDWQLKQSRCVAKVKVTQRLQPPSPAPEPAEPAPATTPPPSCTPGPLRKLRLRPTEAQIVPGERVCFSVRGFDAEGCPVSPDGPNTRWILTKPEGADATLSGGCFKAAERAAEAEGQFLVAVSSAGVRAESTITVASADLSDITARRGSQSDAAEGADEGVSTTIIEDLGIEAAVPRSARGTLALSGLLLACVGVLAWLIQRRTRAADVPPPRPSQARSTPRPSAAAGVHPSQPATAEQRICPTCRRGYPAQSERCARDGTALIPYTEFLRRAQEQDASKRACPACGAQLAAGARFCGECGARIPP